MYLNLDLSSSCVGWSKFTKDGKLLNKGRIEPAKDIANYFKINYLTREIEKLYKGINELIIEDLFYGKNFKAIIYLARLSGAVINSWVNYKYKEPTLYMACRARKLAGLNGKAQKAEIQVAMLKKYKFASVKEIAKYEVMIDNLKDKYKDKEIKKGSFKYRMTKLSNLIDEETSIGNDIADSMVLGIAYNNEKIAK